MDNFISFTDLIRFDVKNLSKIKDDFAGAFKPQREGQGLVTHGTGAQGEDTNLSEGLLVKMKATHSGKIINNRMYLPEKMKNGAITFVKPFHKLVQLHHDDFKDGIGRIVGSEYVDTSGVIKNMLANINAIKDSKTLSIKDIEDFVSGKLSIDDAFNVARLLSSKKITDEDTYEGLGHIEILLHIVDEDAIKKFLDGRYLTGSIGAQTNQAICSICKQDWVKDGMCDHYPGQEYDGVKCFTICGDMKFDEYSIVNNPADEFSQVMELHYNGNITRSNFNNTNDSLIANMPIELVQNSKEDSTMGKDNKKKENKTDGIQITDSTSVVPEPEKVDDTVTAPAPETKVDEKVKTEEVKVDDTATTPEENAAETPEVKTDVDDTAPATSTVPETPSLSEELDVIMKKIFNSESVTKEEKVVLYKAMMDTMKEENPEVTILTDEELFKLPASKFCGPEKTFPVINSDHYKAAKKILELCDEKEVLASLRTNLERKGKAFKVVTVPKDNKFDVSNLIPKDKYSEEQLKSIFDYVSSMVKVEVEDNSDLLDEIKDLEEKLGKAYEDMAVIQQKYDLALTEVHSVQDRFISDKLNIKNNKVELLKLLKVLDSGKVEETEEIAKMQEDLIDLEINKLSKIVDIQKISIKLNDGMSRNPSGETVTNPVETVLDNESGDPLEKEGEEEGIKMKDKSVVLTRDQLEKVEYNYNKLLYSKGVDSAKAYIDSLKIKGYKFPKQDN